MTEDDVIKIVREACDPEKVDPVTKDGHWITVTPAELRLFSDLVIEDYLKNTQSCV